MAASLPIDSIPEPLRQPTTIGLLASLVIHGLVGVSFSTTPPEPPKPQSGVKVVALSPAEQGRLPQAVTQPATLPLPTTVPPLPGTSTLPNFKSPTANFPDSSLYSIPYSPPPPIPWYWTPPLRQSPSGNQSRRPAQTQQQNRPLQSQNSTRQFPTSPQTGQQYTFSEGTKFSISDPGQTTSPPPVARTRPDKIATTTVEQLRQLQQQKREGTGFDGTGTTPGEATDLLNQWLSKVDNQVAKENQQNIRLVADAAPAKLSGVASIAVLVDAQGKIVGEPEVIQSSGYKALNQTALSTVRNHTFSPAPTDRVYLIRVEFNSQAGSTPPPAPERQS